MHFQYALPHELDNRQITAYTSDLQFVIPQALLLDATFTNIDKFYFN